MDKIYSKRQIQLATFLGGPLTAGWLLSANFKVFNKSSEATKTWLFTIVLTLVFLVLAMIWPKLPAAIVVIQLVLISNLTDTYQGNDIKYYQENGKPVNSWWNVVGISILGFAATFLLIFLVAYLWEFMPLPAV